MAKDDDARFGDGTHAAAFDDALSDPVSDSADDFQLIRVASPVKPDPNAVRDLVDAEMAADPLAFSTQRAEPQPGTAEPIPPAPPLGMLPKQRTRAGLRGYRPSLRMPRISLPQPGTVRKVRPSSGSAGIIVAILLMIVFVVLVIEFFTSLISSITNAFT